MTKNTVSIALDRESLARFSRLLGNRPQATGVHCGDDDGDIDGVANRNDHAAAGRSVELGEDDACERDDAVGRHGGKALQQLPPGAQRVGLLDPVAEIRRGGKAEDDAPAAGGQRDVQAQAAGGIPRIGA